jgi:hypothetical protein
MSFKALAAVCTVIAFIILIVTNPDFQQGFRDSWGK